MSERVAIAAALKEEIKAKVGERRGRPPEDDEENPQKIGELNGRETAEVIAERADFGNGRRNSTPEELSYLRGKRYEAEKKPKGGDRKSDKSKPHSDGLNTADKVAAEHGVSPATIERDAAYARAVDTIAGEQAPHLD